jgi:hypothetical protein
VCADGGSYVVERRTHGTTRWTKYDTCTDVDGDDVVLEIRKVHPELTCWIATRAPDYCDPQLPDEPDNWRRAATPPPPAPP